MDFWIIGRKKQDGMGAYHATKQDMGIRLFMLPPWQGGDDQRRKRMRLDGGQIKAIALALMLLDHIGALFLPAGSVAWYFARGLGRLSFPLYAYLAGQGIRHTHDISAYTVRLLVFAFLSEAPFDLALFGGQADNYQNVFFTLALAVGAHWAARAWAGRGQEGSGWKLAVCTACAGAAAQLLHTDYGMCGVFLVSALACAGRDSLSMAAAAWCFLFIKTESFFPGLAIRIAGTAAVAAAWLGIICLDDGSPGDRRWRKWHYAAYPAHLAILWVLRMACFCG